MRILRRTGFHCTPKHASWLNMIEIRVVQRQCLNRRMPDRTTLETGTAAWEKPRNERQVQVNRTFTAKKARERMASAYPTPTLPKGRTNRQNHCVETPMPEVNDVSGWGGRIRTYGTRYQKPLPYHLATPQHAPSVLTL